MEIKSFVPAEFQRKVRSFDHFDFYKATELRQLLLYIAPLIFKNVLRSKNYDNLINLHYSIYSLCSDDASTLAECAEYSLQQYLKEYQDLYGYSQQTYNNHMLLHLPELVKMYGPLDSFSRFPYVEF